MDFIAALLREVIWQQILRPVQKTAWGHNFADRSLMQAFVSGFVLFVIVFFIVSYTTKLYFTENPYIALGVATILWLPIAYRVSVFWRDRNPGIFL